MLNFEAGQKGMISDRNVEFRGDAERNDYETKSLAIADKVT